MPPFRTSRRATSAICSRALAVALVGYAEAISVARGSATAGGFTIKPSRELFALGGANALAGVSQGFVQSGGASQTVAAEGAGARSQIACLVAAAGVLLTGAFLTGLFKELPQATLGAIVVVAVTGFFRVGELQRTSIPLRRECSAVRRNCRDGRPGR
jgi:sulfate permease, SulP family